MPSWKRLEEGRGVWAVLSFLQGQAVWLPGQLTKKPLQLLQCKSSSFPIAILPSTSSSSLHHFMSWLPSPTGSGRMEGGLGYSSKNLIVLGKRALQGQSWVLPRHTWVYHILWWGSRIALSSESHNPADSLTRDFGSTAMREQSWKRPSPQAAGLPSGSRLPHAGPVYSSIWGCY